MRKTLVTLTTAGLLTVAGAFAVNAQNAAKPEAKAAAPAAAAINLPPRDDSASEKLGWKVAVQSYSFNKFTFFESIDKTAAIGIKYMETYPGQKIGGGIEGGMGPGMSEAAIDAVKKKLEENKIKLVCFGVTGIPGKEADARKLFEWAKKMGIENIACELKPEEKAAWDMAEKLADEYQINVAMHNHPKPSPYWNPDTVLKVCEGRSKRIGACADIGHWMRSGLNPLECVKKLKGRIMYFHFKDLDKMGNGHDVPWGTGQADVKAILTELKAQGFKGYFDSEYEYHWENNAPEIGEAARNFDKIAAELAK